MDRNLLKNLIEWRNKQATKEGVEAYMILSTKIIEEIAKTKPKTKEDLTSIKGIKDKKFEKYGGQILSFVNNESFQEEEEIVLNSKEKEENLFSVGDYLNLLNSGLQKYSARIQGEISSLDIRANYIFFSLKDKKDNSLLNCFMWVNSYKLSGITLEEGMEIIAFGFPEIYKPGGRLTFKASTVELVGEGALKKAYDELKKKLTKEGVFEESRKKLVPDFPQKIGIITSKDGAAIGDFLANIGKFGFQISLIDSRVEGQLATRELLKSIQTFKKKDIDCLVIMRGGGSLESLLAFNNETLVREIVNFPKPVLAGIGHEKDISLASLASDKMFSTPTAVAKFLNVSWEKAINKIEHDQNRILSIFESSLREKQMLVNNSFQLMKDRFYLIFEKFRKAENLLKQSFVLLEGRFRDIKNNLVEYRQFLIKNLGDNLRDVKNRIDLSERIFKTYNPERQLELGYSIVRSGDSIIKNINQVKQNQEVNVKIKGGDFDSKVINIKKYDKNN